MKKVGALLSLVGMGILLIPFGANAQVTNGDKVAAFDIPSVFQVFVAANATIAFPQFDVDNSFNITPVYSGVSPKVAALVADMQDQISNDGEDIATVESDEAQNGASAANIASAVDVIQNPGNYTKQKLFSESTVLQSGSGFGIDERGYIVTNAHVVDVDNSDIDQALANDYVSGSSTDSLFSDLGVDPNSDEGQTLSTNLTDYIAQYATLVSSTIAYKILPPSVARTASYHDVMNNGWDAALIYKGDAYPGKDVALLKLDLNYPIPALDLSSRDPSVGDGVYVIGFPGAANLTDQIENQATFTAGTVSAVRKSDNGDFSVYQVDASSGEGSSGGPVLDTDGNVVGILTLGSTDDGGGGNFNYFLPVSLVTAMLSDANITLSSDRSATNNYRAGVSLLQSGDCADGKAKLAVLQSSLDSDFINQMIGLCTPNSDRVELTGWMAYAVPLLIILIALLSFWYHRRRTHHSSEI
jgi:S1-C subfamily serine protease